MYDDTSDSLNYDEKMNVLLPTYHMAMNTQVCIVLDGDGKFRRANNEPLNIAIPCTEDSASKSSTAIFPHPLHENLGYLALSSKKREKYLTQLSVWQEMHPKISAVYNYIKGGTILEDLEASGIKTDDDKRFIRFSVEIPGDFLPNLWEDSSVARAWQKFCKEDNNDNASMCYVTGDSSAPMRKHPKGVNPAENGAKLISANDTSNYTFRGKFTAAEQANSISAESSYKAHAMLKYLIATHGYKCGSQAVAAWAIDDGDIAVNPFGGTYGLVNSLEEDKGTPPDSDALLDTHYAKILRNSLFGVGSAGKLKNRSRAFAVIAVDAATTGRMGITFYQELREDEYLERIIEWHENCRWWFRYDKRDILTAPSADDIIAAVYGETKGEGYIKIKKQARETLLGHIFNGVPVDLAWIRAAVSRVNNPFSFDKEDGGWDKFKWEKAISVTCALMRKYYIQKKEEIPLALDKTCTDRNYLFGRLLAIADKIESHARYLQGGGKDETGKRPTNAVRYMPAFANKPLHTWAIIYRQLNPYIQRLNGASWYQNQIDEIMGLFNPEDLNDNSLEGKYLFGYSLQRLELNGHNKNEEENSNELDEEN